MIQRIISTFFARSTVALLNLAILLIASRQLGSEAVGQLSLLILNIAVVQIVSEIYTGYSLVHYIPKVSLLRVYQTGVLWTLLSIGCINLVFLFFNIGLKAFWLHGLFLSFAITLHSFHCVLLLAKEKITLYNFLILFQPLVLFGVLCAAIFIFRIQTVDSYLTGLYGSYYGSAFLSGFFVIKSLRQEKKKEGSFSFMSILQNGFANQLGNLAHTLSNRYNYYMIGTAALVGIYASATSLIESVWIIGSSVAPIVLTHVANQKDVPNTSRIVFLLAKLSFLLSAACVMIIGLLPAELFTCLLGKDFAGTKTVMLHLAPGILCISFSTVISHYFSGLGQQRVQLVANCLGLLTTISSSYFLISRYQLIGACYAASLSYFVQALVLVIVFMRQHQFKFQALWDIRRDLFLLKK